MIQAAVDDGAGEGSAAPDDHAVLCPLDITAHGPKFRNHDIQTVGFFDFQFLSVADYRGSLREGGQNGHHRQFVDQCRDQSALHRGAGKAAVAHQQIRARLSGGILHVFQGDIGPHGFADTQETVPGGIDPHIFDQQLRSGYQQGSGNKIGGRGDVSRHAQIGRCKLGIRPDGGRGIPGFHPGAEPGQHPLRVIPGNPGFRDGGGCIRIQSGQQYTGFHLGRCHWRIVVDALQRAAADLQRYAAVSPDTFHLRAHLGQRPDNPVHGTALDGSVAGKLAGKWLPGQDAGDQPGGGAAVAHIQHLVGGRQSVQPFAVDQHLILQILHLDPHVGKTSDGGKAVGTLKKIPDSGGSPGQGAQHDRPVADGLVPGDSDSAFQGFLRLCDFHNNSSRNCGQLRIWIR